MRTSLRIYYTTDDQHIKHVQRLKLFAANFSTQGFPELENPSKVPKISYIAKVNPK